MMLACAVTSGEPLRRADIRSFLGVAFQAGPFIQQAPSNVASSVDPRSAAPRHLSFSSARPGRFSQTSVPMARYSCTCTDPWRPPAPSPRRHSSSCGCSHGRRPRNRWTPAMQPEAGHQMQHRMFRLPLGDWHVAGMGQVFPVVTTGGPDNGEGGELRRTEWHLTQPALMANLERPSRRLVLWTTLNCEGVTLGSGEFVEDGDGQPGPRVHSVYVGTQGPDDSGIPH